MPSQHCSVSAGLSKKQKEKWEASEIGDIALPCGLFLGAVYIPVLWSITACSSGFPQHRWRVRGLGDLCARCRLSQAAASRAAAVSEGHAGPPDTDYIANANSQQVDL